MKKYLILGFLVVVLGGVGYSTFLHQKAVPASLGDTINFAGGNKYKEVMDTSFKESVSKISADTFFSKEVIPPEKYNGISEERRKKIHFSIAHDYYEGLTEELCKPIQESYAKIFENGPIKGEKNVYQFGDDLNALMREVGAYVMPLEVRSGGRLEALYYNPNWDRGHPDKWNGNKKFFDDVRDNYPDVIPIRGSSSKGLEPGYIKPSSSLGNGGGPTNFFVFFPKSHRFFTEKKLLELKEFSMNLEAQSVYLFPLFENESSLREEILFLTIKFPFQIQLNEFGKVSYLTLRENNDEVSCNLRSLSEYKAVPKSVSGRHQSGIAYSLLNEPEPLTYPLNDNYPLKKEGSYLVQQDEIVKPSIKCFIGALGYDDTDMKACVNKKYAEEFLEALNKDICIHQEGVSRAKKLEYPYEFNNGSQYYTYNYRHFDKKRCTTESKVKTQVKLPDNSTEKEK